MTTITIGECLDAGIGRASLLEERFSVRVTAEVKAAGREKEYVWVAKVSSKDTSGAYSMLRMKVMNTLIW